MAEPPARHHAAPLGTDTFLIATVFSIGTALLGAGIAQGAMITVVQMLVLTTNHWSLRG